MLVSDLIAGSMRLLGAIASGETPAATELNDAFTALNGMLDSWNTQSQLIVSTGRYVFPLQAGKQTYSIGTGGTPDINTVRPLSIRRAGLLIGQPDPTQTLERPLAVLTESQWALIAVKGIASAYPEGVYYETDLPNGTLAFYPVPQTVNSVALYIDQQLTQFATTGDTLSLAPGYLKALRYCLAVELAPEYGIAPSELVVEQALMSLQYLKNTNVRVNPLRCDPAVSGKRGFWDWMTGETR